MIKINKSRFKFLVLIASVLVFSFVAIRYYMPDEAMARLTNALLLKAGTPVNLRLTETIDTKTKNVGDLVHFEVIGDVKVDNQVVIKAGAPAEGEVTISDKSGLMGEPEKIAFIVRNVTGINGERVPLRASLTREGKESQTMSMILTILLCFLFLLMKGGKAQFCSGTEVRSYVDYDIEFPLPLTPQTTTQ